MEQFLRTYYTNLNPNATEEEILAFLASQGFGMDDQTATGGITSALNVPQDSGGDSGPATRPNIPVGAKPPNLFTRTLATIFAPPVGIAMNLQALADKGKLPGNLNKVFGSRASGDVEAGVPQSIQTGQSFVDEVSLTGGDGGGTFDGATSMEAYSQDPTGYSGSS